MQRLVFIEFGKSKTILGDGSRSNGYNTTQFLMQLNRLIGESSADRFLDGQFIIQDSSHLSNLARLIYAQNDVWQAYKYADATKQNAADLELAIWHGAIPLPALPAEVIYISPDRLNYAFTAQKRAESEEILAKTANNACGGILKELNDRIHSSVHAQLVPRLVGLKHSYEKILVIKNHVETTMYGDPTEDRKAIIKAITEGGQASSVRELEILADNLTFLKRIMEEHHALCGRAGVACEEPITDIALGKAYFMRVDWAVGAIVALNSVLFAFFDQGFLAMDAAMRRWVKTHPSAGAVIEMVSMNFAASASSSSAADRAPRSSGRPCFSWDGFKCAYEKSSGNKCNFDHVRGEDTRRDRSRSRSRDRGEGSGRRGDGGGDSRRDRSASRDRGDSRDRGGKNIWASRVAAGGGGGGEGSQRAHEDRGGGRQSREGMGGGGSQRRDDGGQGSGGDRFRQRREEGSSSGGGGFRHRREEGSSSGVGQRRDQERGGGGKKQEQLRGGGAGFKAKKSVSIYSAQEEEDEDFDSDCSGGGREYRGSPAPKARRD